MQTKDKHSILSGHQGALYDSAWNSIAEEWLTAGGDGVVAKWSFDNPNVGQAVLHHEKAFFCVCVNEDGLVAGTEDGELFFLNNSGSVRRWPAHRGGVFALLKHTNQKIYSGGGDGRVLEWTEGKLTREWSFSSATKIRTLVAHGNSIFISTSNGKGHLWNPNDNASLDNANQLAFHEGGLYAALFIQEKEVWVTGGRDGHLRVWDSKGSEILHIPAHEGAIYRMQRTGDLIWTASRDKTVKSWSMDSLKPISKWTHRNGGCRRSVNALSIGGPNLEWILAGGDDRKGQLIKWQTLLPKNGL